MVNVTVYLWEITTQSIRADNFLCLQSYSDSISSVFVADHPKVRANGAFMRMSELERYEMDFEFSFIFLSGSFVSRAHRCGKYCMYQAGMGQRLQ